MSYRSLLKTGEPSRIWNVQQDLGVSLGRMKHVKAVTSNYTRFRNGDFEHLFRLIPDRNRGFEDRDHYCSLLGQLADHHSNLSFEQQRILEAGTRLHDIGIARSAMDDHGIIGSVMLGEPEILEKLSLDPSYDMQGVCAIVREHNLFSDLGRVHMPDKISGFNMTEQISAAVLGSMDQTGRVFGDEKAHSNLFSRSLERYLRVLGGDFHLDPEERLRQLFGPMNFIWLNETDSEALNTAVDQSGLRQSDGFDMLMNRTFFNCWIMIKDIVSSDISYATTYYTPIDTSRTGDLASFLLVVSNMLAELRPGTDVTLSVPFNSHDFGKREEYITALRDTLGRPGTGLVRQDEDNFTFGPFTFSIRTEENGTSVSLLKTGG